MRPRRYWRRSSRWRKAIAKADRGKLGYWRLQRLADNLDPFKSGAAQLALWIDRECERMSQTVVRCLARPRPFFDYAKMASLDKFPANISTVIRAL